MGYGDNDQPPQPAETQVQARGKGKPTSGKKGNVDGGMAVDASGKKIEPWCVQIRKEAEKRATDFKNKNDQEVKQLAEKLAKSGELYSESGVMQVSGTFNPRTFSSFFSAGEAMRYTRCKNAYADMESAKQKAIVAQARRKEAESYLSGKDELINVAAEPDGPVSKHAYGTKLLMQADSLDSSAATQYIDAENTFNNTNASTRITTPERVLHYGEIPMMLGSFAGGPLGWGSLGALSLTYAANGDIGSAALTGAPIVGLGGRFLRGGKAVTEAEVLAGRTALTANEAAIAGKATQTTEETIATLSRMESEAAEKLIASSKLSPEAKEALRKAVNDKRGQEAVDAAVKRKRERESPRGKTDIECKC